jgi:CRISPR/Cas system CSM-associated protein Csm3 (group 7 of RAMP superfamily)
MHKSLHSEFRLQLNISPAGPVLIKAGENDADPTKPDMSFVRTIAHGRPEVYFPGSSLKGVLRAHCERIARTVDSPDRCKKFRMPLACNPAMLDKEAGRDPLKANYQCSTALDKEAQERKKAKKTFPSAEIHQRSCFLCLMFGNTSLASHVQVSDAYALGDYRTEERNGVAIDRIFGSVAVGPFNYETLVSGNFRTELSIKNFTLAQLGLLFLALRDLSAERVRLGFAKSRGLGLIKLSVEELRLRYPSCLLSGDDLSLIGRGVLKGGKNRIFGVGEFIDKAEGYSYPSLDSIPLPGGYEYLSDGWLGSEIIVKGSEGKEADWQPLAKHCVPKWREEVEHGL